MFSRFSSISRRLIIFDVTSTYIPQSPSNKFATCGILIVIDCRNLVAISRSPPQNLQKPPVMSPKNLLWESETFFPAKSSRVSWSNPINSCTHHNRTVDASTGHGGSEPLIRFRVHLFAFVVEVVSYIVK